MKNKFGIKLINPENEIDYLDVDKDYIWYHKLDRIAFIDRNIIINGISLLFGINLIINYEKK